MKSWKGTKIGKLFSCLRMCPIQIIVVAIYFRLMTSLRVFLLEFIPLFLMVPCYIIRLRTKMPGSHCKNKRSNRKHTPIVSEKQQKAMAVARYSPEEAYGAAKEMARSMPKAELERHLEESKGKKLPKKAKYKRSE